MKLTLILLFLSILFCTKSSVSEPVNILIPDVHYESGEFEYDFKKVKWKGLFKNKAGYYLKDATLKFTKSKEPCEEAYDVELVTVVSTDPCELLIESSAMVNGEISSFIINNHKPIMPNKTYSFTMNGIAYTLSATGNAKTNLPGYAADYIEVNNYKLFLSATINGKAQKQLIYSVDKFNEILPSEIYFAGDLDGDLKPDFYLNTNGSYSGIHYTLFLSKGCPVGKFVYEAAEYEWYGC